jgi:hypothetical protein
MRNWVDYTAQLTNAGALITHSLICINTIQLRLPNLWPVEKFQGSNVVLTCGDHQKEARPFSVQRTCENTSGKLRPQLLTPTEEQEHVAHGRGLRSTYEQLPPAQSHLSLQLQLGLPHPDMVIPRLRSPKEGKAGLILTYELAFYCCDRGAQGKQCCVLATHRPLYAWEVSGIIGCGPKPLGDFRIVKSWLDRQGVPHFTDGAPSWHAERPEDDIDMEVSLPVPAWSGLPTWKFRLRMGRVKRVTAVAAVRKRLPPRPLHAKRYRLLPHACGFLWKKSAKKHAAWFFSHWHSHIIKPEYSGCHQYKIFLGNRGLWLSPSDKIILELLNII